MERSTIDRYQSIPGPPLQRSAASATVHHRLIGVKKLSFQETKAGNLCSSRVDLPLLRISPTGSELWDVGGNNEDNTLDRLMCRQWHCARDFYFPLQADH